MVAAHADTGGWGRADELTERIHLLHAQMLAVQAELLAAIAEYDRERHWEADGAHSMAEWISWDLDLGAGTGRDWACTANRLGDLPGIAGAMAAGDLSYDQVRVLARFATPETDTAWVERGQRYAPVELERFARREKPVTKDESEDAHADRYLRYRRDLARRTVKGTFELPEDAGETLVKSLEREVDAQLEAARNSAEEDRVPYQARLADALVELAGCRIGVDTDPDRATIVIQVPVEALTGVTDPKSVEPGGWILAGPAISAETARRLACDSRHQTVICDEHGLAHSVGPLQRSVSPARSRIIRLRDVTCRWPGCGRTSRLHIHHIVHWAKGGPTTTANCCALCPRHHRMLHEGGYQIEGDANHELIFKRRDGTVIDIRPPPPP